MLSWMQWRVKWKVCVHLTLTEQNTTIGGCSPYWCWPNFWNNCYERSMHASTMVIGQKNSVKTFVNVRFRKQWILCLWGVLEWWMRQGGKVSDRDREEFNWPLILLPSLDTALDSTCMYLRHREEFIILPLLEIWTGLYLYVFLFPAVVMI